MKRALTTMIVGATLALSLPAAAQPDGAKRAQVRQQVTDFMMQRLTQELALDAPTAAQVRADLGRYRPRSTASARRCGWR